VQGADVQEHGEVGVEGHGLQTARLVLVALRDPGEVLADDPLGDEDPPRGEVDNGLRRRAGRVKAQASGVRPELERPLRLQREVQLVHEARAVLIDQ